MRKIENDCIYYVHDHDPDPPPDYHLNLYDHLPQRPAAPRSSSQPPLK